MLHETLLGMLDTLYNTLDCIETKGHDNMDRMLGCMGAINQMKLMILNEINPPESEEPNDEKKEGDEVTHGRPRDIGTDTGTNSKQ